MLFTDQMQRQISQPHWPPKRIISLVPSQTELLADLGLEREVIGITKFCVHPASWFQTKQRVGGTKTLNLAMIEALKPDLIIGNKEENERSQIEALEKHFPVWMSDIQHLAAALDMIRRVGQLCDRSEQASVLANNIYTAFQQLAKPVETTAVKAAYLIWRKPYMAAGGDTFIQDMLVHAGFSNVFAGKMRYPEISPQELAEAQPQVVLLSSEPYPFSEKHIAALQSVCPGSKIMLVDGEMFSWYGSRLLEAAGYFRGLVEGLAT
jgi:ABC-type Fe3+-hydroxamate transport system substrate-binding protein